MQLTLLLCAVERILEKEKLMQCTHLVPAVPMLDTKCTPPRLEKFTSHKKKPCSALAHLMTCGIPSEAVRSSFPVREKIRLNKKKPCNALDHLMKCGILSKAVRSSVRCSKYDDFGLAKNRVSAFR